MMIHVEYSDGTFSKVQRYDLQELIVNKRIRSFLRSSGWVNVECGPIRRRGSFLPETWQQIPSRLNQ
jgi:hypothetical protein